LDGWFFLGHQFQTPNFFIVIIQGWAILFIEWVCMTKRIIGKKQNPEGLSDYHHFSYQILKWQ
jgi:hypothetical protein